LDYGLTSLRHAYSHISHLFANIELIDPTRKEPPVNAAVSPDAYTYLEDFIVVLFIIIIGSQFTTIIFSPNSEKDFGGIKDFSWSLKYLTAYPLVAVFGNIQCVCSSTTLV
jgi:hypothetical protein